jgi:hypothetical protein
MLLFETYVPEEDILILPLGEDATINVNLVLARELNITRWVSWVSLFDLKFSKMNVIIAVAYTVGSAAYNHVHTEVLQLFGQGKLKNIEKLVTRKSKTDNVVEDGLKRLIRDKDKQGRLDFFFPTHHYCAVLMLAAQ